MEAFDYQYVWRLFGTDPYWLTQIIVFITVTYTCCVFGVVFGFVGLLEVVLGSLQVFERALNVGVDVGRFGVVVRGIHRCKSFVS